MGVENGRKWQMKNYKILYKCNRCDRVSENLKLYCDYCGTKLYNKGDVKHGWYSFNINFWYYDYYSYDNINLVCQ